MARRYDSRTTIFSPEGRLYQVEYAMEAISHSGAAVGLLAGENAAVLAAEKRITSKLLDATRSSERLYQVDDHVGVAVAGITADANILINALRLSAQRYTFRYQEPMPIEQLVQDICDHKQGYTQFGGLRPFGVSFLFAGWCVVHTHTHTCTHTCGAKPATHRAHISLLSCFHKRHLTSRVRMTDRGFLIYIRACAGCADELRVFGVVCGGN